MGAGRMRSCEGFKANVVGKMTGLRGRWANAPAEAVSLIFFSNPSSSLDTRHRSRCAPAQGRLRRIDAVVLPFWVKRTPPLVLQRNSYVASYSSSRGSK